MPRDSNNVFTAYHNWLTDAGTSVPFSAANWQQQDADFAAALNDLPVKSTVLTFVDPATDPTTVNPGSLSFSSGIFKIVVKVSGVNQWFNGSSGSPVDLSAYYSRVQIDAANVTRDAGIALKAPLASAPLTGVPTLNGIPLATQNYVQAQVGALTFGAPGTLQTFLQAYNEFITDENALAALVTTVAGKQAHTANLDGWSGLAPTAKQDHSANLDGWSQITPGGGFTAVQQGGGAGQFNNKVYIGWNGTNLGVQVDGISYGFTWPINITGNAATVPWLGVSGRPTLVSAFTNDAHYLTSANAAVSKVNGAFTGDGVILSGSGNFYVSAVDYGVYDIGINAGVVTNPNYGVILTVKSPRGTPLTAYIDTSVGQTVTSFRLVVVTPSGAEVTRPAIGNPTIPAGISFAVVGG